MATSSGHWEANVNNKQFYCMVSGGYVVVGSRVFDQKDGLQFGDYDKCTVEDFSKSNLKSFVKQVRYLSIPFDYLIKKIDTKRILSNVMCCGTNNYYKLSHLSSYYKIFQQINVSVHPNSYFEDSKHFNFLIALYQMILSNSLKSEFDLYV